MHQLIPSILTTAHGEIGLFDHGPRPDGKRRWEVARPIPQGWEALGAVETTTGGYAPSGPFPMRPVESVPVAAALLAQVARHWDLENDHPAPLQMVPAHDVGPGGRVYAEVAA